MKLTNEIRDELMARVWKYVFEKKEQAHKRDLAVFGIKVLREHSIDPKTLALIDGLPAGICPTVSSISFKLGGDYHTASLGDEFRIPARLKGPSGSPCVLVVDDFDDPIVVEWRALKDQSDSLKAEIGSTMAEVAGVLYSCSTRKQLLTAWPELKTIAGSLLDSPEKPGRLDRREPQRESGLAGMSVQVPAWILAALVQDCRAYGLCGKYLDQAEDLLEAQKPPAVPVDQTRGPTNVYIAAPSTQEACHGEGGEPCAFENGAEVRCHAINRLRPCWSSPGIIWREVK